jgi:excinuclease ABC subunit C
MNQVLEQKIALLPKSSGVYVMRNKYGQVIYVGKAKNLKNRAGQYFLQTQKHPKVQAMLEHVYDLEYFLTPTEIDALALEANLIKKYKPHYNILLKDDKHFAYIRVDLKQEFPRFEIVRKIKKDGAKYFGPYVSGVSANEILKTIHLAFPLRTHNIKIYDSKQNKRSYGSFSLTSVSSKEKITKEQYDQIVKQTIDFLSGRDDEIENILKQKMLKNAQNQNFEQALLLRDKIKMIEKMKEKTIVSVPRSLDLDAFGIAFDGLSCAISVLVCRGGKMLGVQNFSLISVSEQKGEMLAQFMLQYYEKNTIPHEILIEQNWPELQDVQTLLQSQKNGAVEFVCPKIAHKAKLVEMANSNAQMHLQNSISREKQKQNQTWGAITRLAEKLNLNSLPRRMECFDISNLGGTNSVASMVVFTDGEPDKKSYRKFKIRTVEGPNDFLSMQEALTRRLEKIKNGELDFGAKPNLIVIDGGKGQLSAAYEILQKSGVDGIEMISLAKQFEEVYKPNQSAPIMLERNSAELKLLQRLRDEAHRFAITFHRQLRSKNSFQSSLDNIERLGENKKKLLFATFGSVEKIKAASVEQLQQVNGIGKVLAQNIYNALHKEENN